MEDDPEWIATVRKRLFNYLTAGSCLLFFLGWAPFFLDITIPFSGIGVDWKLTVQQRTFILANGVQYEASKKQLNQQWFDQNEAFWRLHAQWEHDCFVATLDNKPLPPEPQKPPEIVDSLPRSVAYEVSPFAVLGCSLILPAIWYALLLAKEKRIRDRKAAGCCVECGFDLRHSQTRCPECGMLTHPSRVQSQ